jgi:hypothetical protein
MRHGDVLPAGGVTVNLRGGTYMMEKGFELTADDSGTADCPIVVRGFRDEPVRLVGGRRVPADAFERVSGSPYGERVPEGVRSHVWCADLKKLGITDYGEFPVKFRGATSSMELFFNAQPMQLARWPNDGWVTIKSVIDRGGPAAAEDGKATNGTFEYAEDRPARWDVAKGVWLHGYWCHDWYDEVIRVGSIDTQKKQITLAAPHGYGIGPSHSWNKAPRRYYALNVLEELDAPGEWYVDRDQGILYFWPPQPLETAEVMVSVLDDPLISLKDTSHVTVRNMTFDCTRGPAVSMSGGSDNVIAACTIRNTGRHGVSVSGMRNGVVGCDITRTGTGGIVINGGDRKTLEAAENYAENNLIHHFARRQRTYAAGVHLNGVGNRVSHNVIHSCPHAGILYGGNENLIEYNEIFLTCQETGDVGALYTGRDWGTQGNVIQYNFIHHTGGVRGWSMGVYLDDCDSGDTIRGNAFYRVTRAAFIGGGRDNKVINNLFVDCSPAVHVDDRGKSRIKWDMAPGDSWNLPAKLQKYDYRNPPWSERYPHLVNILEDHPELPLHNTIARNVAVGGKWLNARGNIQELLDMHDNYITDEDPGFVNPEALNFRLRKRSPVWEKVPGFEPLPWDRIGLYRSPLRASWPVQTPPVEGGLAAPEETQVKPAGPLPVFTVAETDVSIDVDGTLRAEEWRDADKAGTMLIAENIGGQPAKPVSHAWIMAGKDGLMIAVENEVGAGKNVKTCDDWGSCDAVEIAIQAVLEGKKQVLAYRWFASGTWVCSDEAGATKAAAEKASQGVRHAATVDTDAAKWTSEWLIPWKALGMREAGGAKLLFNITVRKTGDNLWLMWQGTGGYSWQVEKAGYIQLPK